MEKIFEKLGLSPKDSRSYLELVTLGACPVSVWAKQAGVKRSSMYVLLERLKSHGLISTFSHLGVLHVQSVPMSELPALLSDKLESLSQTREIFLKSLPELQKLEKNHGLTPKVTFYEGVSRVQSMYERVLQEKSFKSFFHPGRIMSLMPTYFHKIPKTLRKNDGKAQEILVACPEASEYKSLYNSPKHNIKIFNADLTFSSDTIITSEKIYMVGYNDKTVVGTEIWNKELALTQSTLFDLIWNTTT